MDVITSEPIEESISYCFNTCMTNSSDTISLQQPRITMQALSLSFAFVTASNLPLFLPLLNSRFFWSHENAYFLWRVVAFHQNAIAGEPFCRWFPDFARGFGLPFLEFYPVLPLYITEGFKLSGASTFLSVKLTIMLVSVLAAWGAFLLGRSIWGIRGGLITAVLFSYAPYKLVNLFVRGDINEYVAMAASPWILYLIVRSASTEIRHPVSLPGIIVFGIPAITHYPSCVIQYPVYVFWMLCLFRSAKQPRRFLLQNSVSLAGALSVTSTYWASAFFSRHLVQMEGMTRGFADYRQHFITAAQWFSSYWNFGASVKGPGDAISFQIGNIAFIAMMAGIPFVIRPARKIPLFRNLLACSLICLIASVYLTHASSAWLWTRIPVLPMLQFAYRLLAIPALMISILGGSAGLLLEKLPHRSRPWLTAGFIVLIVIGSVHMCRVAAFMNLSDSDITPLHIRKAAHTHCTGEYIPRAVGKRFPPPVPVTFALEKIPEEGFTREQTEARLRNWLKTATDIETWNGTEIPIGSAVVKPGGFDVIEGRMTVAANPQSTCSTIYRIDAETSGTLRINIFYFEGWTAEINGREAPLHADPDTGLIRVEIPPGQHDLHVNYRNVPVSRSLSILGLITATALVIWRFYGIRKK